MTRAIALALAAALVVPTAAAAQTKPKAPSGKFTIKYRGTGSLRVKEKKLTSLSVVPVNEDTACGTTSIKLKTVHTLTTVTRAGYTNWIVGKPTPKKTDAYQYVSTKVLFQGEVVKAKIRVIWRDTKNGRAQLIIGSCDLDVDFVK